MAEEEIIMVPPTLRVVAPKPKMTIYYALLILALLAMLTACLFMYLEIRRLTSAGPVSGKVSSLERPTRTLLADQRLA
jgi:hypothetical protein